MIYVKVGNSQYSARVVTANPDRDWDNRDSKTIFLQDVAYETVNSAFYDNVAWSIIQETTVPVADDSGKVSNQLKYTETDLSSYSIKGPITVYSEGICSIKMGKPSALESMQDELNQVRDINNMLESQITDLQLALCDVYEATLS